MQAHLVCFSAGCRAQYDIHDVLYNCPKCGGLLEAQYDFSSLDSASLRKLWRERRMDNAPLSQSGVWRYREMFPFLSDTAQVVTLREGNTPLLPASRAAEYGGLKSITFKHQGFNPTGSFKDNGMTAGAAQARVLAARSIASTSCGLSWPGTKPFGAGSPLGQRTISGTWKPSS